ncbi:MAG: copper chaperone PCu(A)C [Xanthobacteraceae bacterium]
MRHLAIALSMSAAVALSVAALPAKAQHVTAGVKAGDLVIVQPWSRATPGGAKVAGGFLVIENKGASADTLVGGTTGVAAKVEVHEMAVANGIMTMRELERGLPIAAGQSVTLKPGGYHIMFTGLKQPLKEGDKVPVTLQFAKAGKVDVTFDVRGVGAKDGGGARPHK